MKGANETGLIGGVEKRQVVIVEYDPTWPGKFHEHAVRLAAALGQSALRIEHIGSTAVPGLAAKPVIDVLIVVQNSADESSYLPQIEAAGYELRVREPDWHEHRMFRTPHRDVHVHVFSRDCQEIERHLIFRDWLRSHADDRQHYEAIKRKLAKESWPGLNAYAQAKTECIESMIAKAGSRSRVSP